VTTFTPQYESVAACSKAAWAFGIDMIGEQVIMAAQLEESEKSEERQ